MRLRLLSDAECEIIDRIRNKAEYHKRKWRELTPQLGRIPVGGAHIAELVYYQALTTFINSALSGKDLSIAVIEAKEVAALIVKDWNRHREPQVHFWEGMADSIIEDAWRKLV